MSKQEEFIDKWLDEKQEEGRLEGELNQATEEAINSLYYNLWKKQ